MSSAIQYIAVLFLMATSVFAASPQKSNATSLDAKGIEGDWTMTVKDPKTGESYIFTLFTFHVDGNKLTGFAQAPHGNRRFTLEDGKVNGTELSFGIDEGTITGRLLSDTSMEITWTKASGTPHSYKIDKTPGVFKTLPEPPTAVFGVDQSKMGPYRKLANLAYDNMKKGDMEDAAMYCQILERFWDHESAVFKKSQDLWREIDKAMDGFIGPIKGYQKHAPDQTKVQAAYENYLERLKKAD